MKCHECPYFHIKQKPIGHWDLGLAKCRYYDMVINFVSMRKVNSLECVKEEKKHG